MTSSNETRPLGAAGFGETSFCRCDNPENNRQQPGLSSADHARSRARLRRQRHVEHLHRLGPSPLGHFIREVEVATGADITSLLETYAKIDSEFVRVLWGDKFPPAFLCPIEADG
jgi:hypothetical protein